MAKLKNRNLFGDAQGVADLPNGEWTPVKALPDFPSGTTLLGALVQKNAPDDPYYHHVRVVTWHNQFGWWKSGIGSVDKDGEMVVAVMPILPHPGKE